MNLSAIRVVLLVLLLNLSACTGPDTSIVSLGADHPSIAAERLAAMQSQADGDLQLPLPGERRVRSGPVLAVLRYQGIEASGEISNLWYARVVVPAPAIRQLYDRMVGTQPGCPAECQESVSTRDGLMLHPESLGESGVRDEWILRASLGLATEIEAVPFRTQDMFARAPMDHPLAYLTTGGISRQSPQRIRVTLVDVCSGTLRAGMMRRLDFAENAAAPVPTGMTTSRWLEFDGCTAQAHRGDRAESLRCRYDADCEASAARSPRH